MNKDILVLIQITEEQYNNMFLDFGMNYCEHYTAGDNDGSRKLKESAYFWKWWHNQYATIDNSFIKKYSNTAHSLDFLREKYKRMHDAKYMSIYPSDWVIQGALSGIVYGKKQKQEIC